MAWRKRGNAPDRRVAAELVQMLLQEETDEGRDHRLGLAERKVDRRRAGLDPFKQPRQTRERRRDQFVEAGERGVAGFMDAVLGDDASARQWLSGVAK